MSWPKARRLIQLLARVVLGVALIVAGAQKLPNLTQSVVAVKAYQFGFSEEVNQIIGYALPVVEIVVGLAILVGWASRFAAIVAVVMLAVYIGAISSAWARGLTIDCGCFTPGGALTDPGQSTAYLQDIVRDIGLIILAGWVIIWPRSPWSIDAWLTPAAPPIDPIITVLD
ncbi:MAG: DoxX family protein [Propionibacteriaceae bacterium]|jgi:uncharacterized membrane protein YphA (DoxX/SURF4 family)|nr:DoxX family protein [Propionibacteriaceae bacterium]